MLNTYDKFTLFQYFGKRPFSRKNMHFSINCIVSVPPFWLKNWRGNMDLKLLERKHGLETSWRGNMDLKLLERKHGLETPGEETWT